MLPGLLISSLNSSEQWSFISIFFLFFPECHKDIYLTKCPPFILMLMEVLFGTWRSTLLPICMAYMHARFPFSWFIANMTKLKMSSNTNPVARQQILYLMWSSKTTSLGLQDQFSPRIKLWVLWMSSSNCPFCFSIQIFAWTGKLTTKRKMIKSWWTCWCSLETLFLLRTWQKTSLHQLVATQRSC